MKKLLYSLTAVAALVFAASCSRETAGVIDNSDLVEVTFNLGTPEEVATKAISDGTHATELLFFAFDGNGKYLENVKPAEPVTVSGYNASVTVKLIKGMTYNFVFWAQTPGKYTSLISATNGKVGATLDISTVAAAMMNDDSFDAFYGRIQGYKVEKAFSTETLYLTRPFAQVNVGAYADDIAAAQASNLETGANVLKTKYFLGTEGKLKVNTTLDLLTGAAAGATEIDLTAALRPAEDLNVASTNYTWLAMLYLLQNAPDYYDNSLAFVDAEETKSVEPQIDFNIATTQNGDAVTTDRNVYNVPVQRNYRTNILGNIFSVDGTFNIQVDQNFQKINDAEQPYLPEYADIDALNKAFAKADATDADKWSYKVKVLAAGDTKEIKLPATTDPVDIVLADGAWAAEEISIVYAAEDAAKPTKLTLKVDELKKLTADIRSTHFELVAGSHVVTAEVATSNTTFVIQTTAKVDNLKINAGGLVIEEGATVENISVDINADVTLPENYEGEVEYFGEIESKVALEKAIEKGGEFTIAADIPDADGIFLAAAEPKDVSIDLGGHTLGLTKAVGSAGTVSQALHLEKGSTVVIKNGTITGSPADGVLMLVQNYADLTLDSVILDFTESNRSYALSNNFGHVTITGNTEINVAPGKTAFDLWYGMSSTYADGVYVTFDENFTGVVNGNIEYGAGAYGKTVENWQEKAVLNIKGNGTFAGSFVASSTGALDGANISITGGTFTENPSAFVAPGYIATQNEEGLYVVAEGQLELTGIEITAPTKTDYFVGETIDLAGLVVTAKYNNNTTQVVTDYTTNAAEVLAEAGENKDVTVTFEGKTATFKVNVTAVALDKIEVTKAPTKVDYYVGDEIDLTGIEITATNNNGATFKVTEGYTTNAETILAKAGADQDVTVTYQEKTATFKVNVAAIPTYTVTISSTVANGSIQADKEAPKAGDLVTLTMTPAEGYHYVAGSVSITDVTDLDEDGNTVLFEMPAKNVTVSATFEADAITIAQLKEKLTTTSQNFNYELKTIIVSGVSGSSAFIEDATGGMVIFKSNHGLTAGKSITGLVAKTGVLYAGNGNLPEITSFDIESATIADVELPLAEKTVTEVNNEFAVLVGQRVKLTGVTFPEVTSSTKNQTIEVTQGESTIKVYAKITDDIVAGSVANIIGNVTNYQNNNQITVTEADAIDITYAPVPQAVISDMPATLTNLKAGDSYTFAAKVNNVSGATVNYAITDGASYAALDGAKLTINTVAAAGSVVKVTASVDGVAGSFDAAEPVVCTITVAETSQGGGDTPTPVKVDVTLSDYAEAHSWGSDSATNQKTLVVDDVITATASATDSNTGKYYTDWRFYQTGSAKLTISATSGYTIQSVTLTYTNSNNGVLYYNDDDVTSGTAVSINSSSAEFSVGGTASKKNGQIRFTAISVTYIKNN